MENVKSYCSCTQCGRVFAYKSYLIDHMKTHIDEKSCKPDVEEKGKISTGEVSQSYQVSLRVVHKCNVCGKPFSRRSNLMQHMKVHTPDRPFNCSECGKTFPRKSALNKHKIVHSNNKPFSCNECGKSFSTKSAVFLHIRLHTGEKPFKCALCGESFYQKIKLTDHHRQYHLCDGFSCNECRRTRTESCENGHKKAHTSEKPHKLSDSENDKTRCGDEGQGYTLNVNALNSCDVCGKLYSCRSSLQLHMRVHTREKPFECSICKKTFTRKSSLTEHLNLHSGHKPYICNQCGKSFSLKATLILHIRIHTGDKPFKCSECGEDFYQKSKLTNHKRLYHFHDRPFGCNICGKTFVEKCALDEHMTEHGRLRMTSLCQPKGSVDRTRMKYVKKHTEVQKSQDKYSESPSGCISTVKIENDSADCAAIPPTEHMCFVKTEDGLVEYSSVYHKPCTNSMKIENDPLEIKSEASS